MAGEILPIELNLTEGTYYTLWAPRWREGDEDWEGFLGVGTDFYVFNSVADLATYVKTNPENDLSDHPLWPSIINRHPTQFKPAQANQYNLIDVPSYLAENPTPESISQLERIFDITRTIGEVCDNSKITKFFNGNILLGAITTGNDDIYTKQGIKVWEKIGKIINKNWEAVIAELDKIIITPKFDTTELDNITDQLSSGTTHNLETSESPTAVSNFNDSNFESNPEKTLTESDMLTDTTSENSVEITTPDQIPWQTAGIDPIQIQVSGKTYYSLRCFLAENPIFLGNKNAVYLFSTPKLLLDYIKQSSKHSLTQIITYPDLQKAANQNELVINITEENIYILDGVADDIRAGIVRINKNQLVLATELIADIANFVKNEELAAAIHPNTPLGWLIQYVANPKKHKLAPTPPFDNEAEAWEILLEELNLYLKIDVDS